MQLNGYVDYFRAYSEKRPYYCFIQGMMQQQPIYFLRKKDILIIPEIEVSMMDNASIDVMIAQSSLIFRNFSFCKAIYIFGLENSQITTFNKSMHNYKLIASLCKYPDWTCSADLRRKINKAMKTFRFSYYASYAQIVEGIQLASYADYYQEDAVSDMKRSIYYYKTENTVKVIACVDHQVVGCMFGAIFGNEVYMLEHNYNPKYVKSYLNDGLYYSFLNQANGTEMIHKLGMTAKSDKGLCNMKAKYSTTTLEKNVLIIDKY